MIDVQYSYPQPLRTKFGRAYLKRLSIIRESCRLVVPYFVKFWRERLTYRTQLVLMSMSSLIGFIQFGLLGAFLSMGGQFPGIEAYGGNIVGFLVTGSIGSSMLLMMMGVAKNVIQEEQRIGTLEMMASSRAGLGALIVTRLVVNFLSTVVTSSVLVAVFFLIFDIKANVDIVGLILAVVVGSLLMSAVGVCAAGYILNSKAGEPFTWTVTTIMGLFSGVLFPVEIYPGWLSSFAQMLPTTAIMAALRTTTLSGASPLATLSQLIPSLVSLMIFIPLGIFMFKWGMNQARTKGSIGQY